MPDLQIALVPCRSDNYAVLLADGATGEAVLVDAPDAAPIAAALDLNGWRLVEILITHHHGDHVAGIEALKGASGARVTGPAAEASKIPGLDRTVGDGDRIEAGPLAFEVIATPGHTAGHVAYHAPAERLLFAGDTLFAMGCGRLFEGTAAEMFASLGKLAALPAETRVYCGHEYTLSNARFARRVDPDNPALAERAEAVERLRDDGLPTVPTTIGLERATNPFLRAGEPALAAAAGLAPGTAPAEVFAALRRMKDNA